MSAGTAYAKRYAGGFVNLPTQTTAIDQTFLNAVEVALLQLLGSAPTADGQVAQWDFANTRFGPALLLNKNIDPAAAIVKSKLDFTGANGIVNADVAGAAAIARSKLDFGAGLVNADVAAAAAIAYSKLSLAGAIQFSDLAFAADRVYERRSTLVDVNTSASELSLYDGSAAGAGTGWTVAANDLGTNKVYRLTLIGDYLFNNAGANTLTCKIKLGGSAIWANFVINGPGVVGAVRHPFTWTILVGNRGATNSQWMAGYLLTEDPNESAPTTGEGRTTIGATIRGGGQGATAAVDSTAAMKLDVTAQWSASSINNSLRVYYALSEVL